MQTLLSIIGIVLPSLVFAQQNQLSPETLNRIGQEISNVKELVADLDSQAENCATAADSTDCQDFSSLINGDFLPQYLELCHSLKDWRELLAGESAGDGVNPQQGPQVLQHLMDVEYNCGEDALTNRTQFVLVAWNKIRSPGYRTSALDTTLPNQYESNALNYNMRNSLLNGVGNQQQRLKAETQQLWQRLELENLRQQSRRPIDFGTINQ